MRICNPTAIGLERCPFGALTERTRCVDCERAYQQQRGSTTERGYGSAWQTESRDIRAAHPWCSWPECGVTNDLTVDHPSRRVFCRTHHQLLEAQRRSGVLPPGGAP